MSPALNLLSSNLQVYGPSESLPCLGVSGRAVSISSSPRSEHRTLHMSVMSPKCYLRHKSFVCKARFEGQRRDSDFSRQNEREFSRSGTRLNEERDDSDDLGESEFLLAKNGRLPYVSNSKKHHATGAPGPMEREIVELFMKVQASLRERLAVKEGKSSEAGKKQNEESDELVGPLLELLSKSDLEKRTAKTGLSNEFRADRKIPQQSRKFYEEKGKDFLDSINTVREEAQETKRPSFSRPVSNFQRRSPVPRIRYEPIFSSEESFNSVSYSDLDEKSGETQYEPDLGAEAEFDFESDMDLPSDEELEEEPERPVLSETDPVNGHAAEFSTAEEDNVDEREAEKQHTKPKDLSAMKLGELRELARARGVKGYSRLKKSELLGLLNEDAI